MDVSFAGTKTRLAIDKEGLVQVAVYEIGAAVSKALRDGNIGDETKTPSTFFAKLGRGEDVASARKREWDLTWLERREV